MSGSARIDVQVLPIEPDYCDYCSYDDKAVLTTHTITVTGWYGAWGASGRLTACQEHAREIERALRSRTVEYNTARRLFDRIKHGDAEHQRWLREELEAFFSGQPRVSAKASDPATPGAPRGAWSDGGARCAGTSGDDR